MAGIEESLTQFPADLQNVPGGQYYFESSGASDVVTYNGTVRALDWPGFQTPVRSTLLIDCDEVLASSFTMCGPTKPDPEHVPG